jgi:hypothetical protein
MGSCDQVDLDDFVELRFRIVHVRKSLQYDQARRQGTKREFAEAVGEDRTDVDLP